MVIIVTIALWFYNNNIKNTIEEINAQKNTIQEGINAAHKNPELVVYSLIQSNTKGLDNLEKFSQITTYIKELRRMALKYKFNINGFYLSGGTLSTDVTTNSGDYGIAYKLVRDFIKDYRGDEDAIFTLDFIDSIVGYDSMKYSIQLDIK